MLAETRDVVPGSVKNGRHAWAVRSAMCCAELVRAGCCTAADLDALEVELSRIKPEGGTDWLGVVAWAITNAAGDTDCQMHNPSAEATASSAFSKPTGSGTPPARAGDGFTDARLSETVARDVFAGRYLWAKGMGWLRWDGRRWLTCVDKEPTDAVREYLLERHAAAAVALAEGNGDKAHVDGWRGTLSASRIGALFRLATGVEGVLTDPSDFDSRPDLLNVGNGVVDLATGRLLPHDPDLRLTKLTPVDYKPGASHPDWAAALGAVPEDARDWYQLRLGQAATGHMTPDDLLVVQVGGGANGKTTLMAGIRGALGEFYVTVSHRALMGDASQHPTELMVFRGARLAVVEETPEARRLSTVRLKQAVGTPQMRARYIRQDEVEWDATHALVLSTNYRPDIEETDNGTWRRLALLRFPYTFKATGSVEESAGERCGDPRLRDRLQAGREGQHEAVLAWLVEGAKRWYAADRAMPDQPISVKAETRDWRGENDLVLAYLDEHLVFEASAHVSTSDLLEHFNVWLASRGHRPWADKTFTGR
ncbi:MAG: phage/plasmid primase, P4 family [Nocardioides sp.]